jgi:hypothetical protein
VRTGKGAADTTSATTSSATTDSSTDSTTVSTADAGSGPSARPPGRTIGWLLLIVTVLGTVAFAVFGDGLRSGGSFLGGVVLAGGVFAAGQFNLRMANQISPGLTLAVAMFSYLLTVGGLEVVLAASRPTVIDPVAIAVGLTVGVVGWLARLIDVLRVRPGRP